MSRYYRGYYGGRPTYTFIGGGGLPRAVKILLITNAAVFVLQMFENFAGGGSLITNFGLRPAAVTGSLQVWQLVTYMFLHGGFFHILFNMFALWMFGSELEQTWGARPFVRYYFVCGVGAGLLTVLMDPASPIPTIGASGAVYGILLAYGLLFPYRVIYLYAIVPIQARYFVILIGAIAFLSSLSSAGSGIAHIAHLGGMAFGYVYLKWANWGRRGPGLRERYDQWRRQRLRRRFDVYYSKRNPGNRIDHDNDPDRWPR